MADRFQLAEQRDVGVDLLKGHTEVGAVDTAVRELGMAGFNRVWESPATLPTRQEIREPLLWVARLSGPPAITA